MNTIIYIFNKYTQQFMILLNDLMKHHESLEFFSIEAIQIETDGCFIILKNGIEYIGILIRDTNAINPFKNKKIIFRVEGYIFGENDTSSFKARLDNFKEAKQFLLNNIP